jgi:hypothetical protein
MKNAALFGLATVLTAIMASCGNQQVLAPTESAVFSDLKYSVNGALVSTEAVKQLEQQYGHLFYLASGTSPDTVVEVFTSKDDLELAKNNQVATRGICIGRSKSSFWEEVGYAGERELEISKGSSRADLRNYFQQSGEDWDNDIEALKLACNAWTYLYTGYNFDPNGSLLVLRGDAISNLTGWNNVISSIEVGN